MKNGALGKLKGAYEVGCHRPHTSRSEETSSFCTGSRVSISDGSLARHGCSSETVLSSSCPRQQIFYKELRSPLKF